MSTHITPKWYDKTTTRSGNLSGERRDEYYSFNMSGVDARHMGIEVNFIYIPSEMVRA